MSAHCSIEYSLMSPIERCTDHTPCSVSLSNSPLGGATRDIILKWRHRPSIIEWSISVEWNSKCMARVRLSIALSLTAHGTLSVRLFSVLLWCEWAERLMTLRLRGSRRTVGYCGCILDGRLLVNRTCSCYVKYVSTYCILCHYVTFLCKGLVDQNLRCRPACNGEWNNKIMYYRPVQS